MPAISLSPTLSSPSLEVVLTSMACALTEKASSNIGDETSAFASSCVPVLGALEYMRRLHKYLKCSPSCFVAASVYLDRVLASGGSVGATKVQVTHYTLHRLVLVATMLACKMWEDAVLSVSYYATVGGVDRAELMELEAEFLQRLDFNLAVEDNVLRLYHTELTEHGQECELCTAPHDHYHQRGHHRHHHHHHRRRRPSGVDLTTHPHVPFLAPSPPSHDGGAPFFSFPSDSTTTAAPPSPSHTPPAHPSPSTRALSDSRTLSPVTSGFPLLSDGDDDDDMVAHAHDDMLAQPSPQRDDDDDDGMAFPLHVRRQSSHEYGEFDTFRHRKLSSGNMSAMSDGLFADWPPAYSPRAAWAHSATPFAPL